MLRLLTAGAVRIQRPQRREIISEETVPVMNLAHVTCHYESRLEPLHLNVLNMKEIRPGAQTMVTFTVCVSKSVSYEACDARFSTGRGA
jgi:hypothetical protein